MEEGRRSTNARIIAGVLVIIFGFLLLLENLGYMSGDYTPGFLLSALGILVMTTSRKKIFGAVMLIIGLAIFVSSLPGVNDAVIFPGILIAFGLFLIFRNRYNNSKPDANIDETNTQGGSRFNFHRNVYNQDMLDEVAVFGGGHKTFSSEKFQGGNVTAVFGGHEIDLTQCKLADGEHVLDVLAIFGGCELIVPRDWNIVMNITPLFGGFSNKIRRDPNWVADPSKTLIIKGLVIFGGGELKAY